MLTLSCVRGLGMTPVPVLHEQHSLVTFDMSDGRSTQGATFTWHPLACLARQVENLHLINDTLIECQWHGRGMNSDG